MKRSKKVWHRLIQDSGKPVPFLALSRAIHGEDDIDFAAPSDIREVQKAVGHLRGTGLQIFTIRFFGYMTMAKGPVVSEPELKPKSPQVRDLIVACAKERKNRTHICSRNRAMILNALGTASIERRYLTANELADIVYRNRGDGGPNAADEVIRVTVSSLRKLGWPIENIHSRGYCFGPWRDETSEGVVKRRAA